MAADEKYPVVNKDNLTIPIQMQSSQKKNTILKFFTAFLKSRSNLKYFEKKDEPHRFCLSEIRDSEKVVKWTSKMSNFRGPFDKQHGKRAKALLKSASQHSYIHIHIYTYSLITAKLIELDKVSLIKMQNLGTAC